MSSYSDSYLSNETPPPSIHGIVMLSKIAHSASFGFGRIASTFGFDKPIRNSNDIRLVFYHGIGDKSSPCMQFLSDELNEQIFSQQIDYLSERYEFISLEDVTSKKPDSHPNQKPLCSISFDDGLSTVYSKAFPILTKKGIPFTVFLNTNVINNSNLLWLHSLSYLCSTYGLKSTTKSINALLQPSQQITCNNFAEIEAWFRSNIEYLIDIDLLGSIERENNIEKQKIANEENLYLTWEQIDEMHVNGVTFYSHTHRHFPLNSFSDCSKITSEISLAKEILSKHKASSDSSFISFPFGMEVDYGARAIKYALQAGHKYIVEVGDGLNSETRVSNSKLISRVGLGNVNSRNASLYTAIEVWPIVKSKLKAYKRIFG